MVNKRTIIVILCITILLMTVGYAVFSSNLKINGTANIESNWEVLFTKIEEMDKTKGVTINEEPIVNETTVKFNVDFKNPGDKIIYNITLANRGTLNAIIDNINASETGSDAIYFKISGINKGDLLNKNTEKIITVEIGYYDNIVNQPGILENQLMISINAVQNIGQTVNTETPTIKNNIMLKRANTSTITPKLLVDWANLSRVELTARTWATTQNILLATYNGQYIGIHSGNWAFTGITAIADMDYKDFANGQVNTVNFNISDGGTSREYITIGWDAVWNKELDIKEIKFYGKNNNLILHILASSNGKFLDVINNKYLDNYSSPAKLTTPTDKLYDVVVGD